MRLLVKCPSCSQKYDATKRKIGSRFRCRCGKVVQIAEPQAHEAAVVKAPAPELPRGDQTLLLVEDESSVRTLLQDTLERHGYHVIAAEHQAAALALVMARVDPIDLVITDVVMPGGTGPELVQALEAIMPGVPTLYISGFADPVLGQHGFPKASHFLQKPFSAGDLLLRVNQILTG